MKAKLDRSTSMTLFYSKIISKKEQYETTFSPNIQRFQEDTF